jgi:hypothetical protein
MNPIATVIFCSVWIFLLSSCNGQRSSRESSHLTDAFIDGEDEILFQGEACRSERQIPRSGEPSVVRFDCGNSDYQCNIRYVMRSGRIHFSINTYSYSFVDGFKTTEQRSWYDEEKATTDRAYLEQAQNFADMCSKFVFPSSPLAYFYYARRDISLVGIHSSCTLEKRKDVDENQPMTYEIICLNENQYQCGLSWNSATKIAIAFGNVYQDLSASSGTKTTHLASFINGKYKLESSDLQFANDTTQWLRYGCPMVASSPLLNLPQKFVKI